MRRGEVKVKDVEDVSKYRTVGLVDWCGKAKGANGV
jgi:hypothetical protein